MQRLAWLFDVDGTLIRTYGAAREAFSLATQVLLGRGDGLEDIPFAGNTDPRILGAILAKHGRTLTHEETNRFWEIVRGHMGALLADRRGHVLPGVVELLGAIEGEAGWAAALLTGNTGAMARIKLGHFGLLDAFAFGAFGDEAEDRDALACLAVARARARWGVPAERCVVVGDTPLDVRCARAAGARVVAVATGVIPRDQLATCAPDLLVDDLSDTAGLLAWARSLP
jgi:phosphoglycolate phosphatase-like HAD superfamily hydrolase